MRYWALIIIPEFSIQYVEESNDILDCAIILFMILFRIDKSVQRKRRRLFSEFELKKWIEK